MNEQFQYMKLKIDTPIASAPIVVTESPKWPAIIVLTIPIMGTVMFDIMFGSAMRKISLFIIGQGIKFTPCNKRKDRNFVVFFGCKCNG